MIRKIISSGQSGVESAALDVAVKLGIAHGGWTSRNMKNADGGSSVRYKLEAIAAVGFEPAVERNVTNADGTLLISRGQKTPQTRFAVQAALKQQKQLLHIDLNQYALFEAASLVSSWIAAQKINVVYVTGPSAEEDQVIYDQSRKILETALYLGFVKTGLHPEHGESRMISSDQPARVYPQTVLEAVEKLKSLLPLKDRAVMANMKANELEHLRSGLGEYIKQNFGLYAGNKPLLQSCARVGRLNRPLADEASAVILKELWKDLNRTHRLRVIK